MKTTFKENYLTEVKNVARELNQSDVVISNIEWAQRLFIETLYKSNIPIIEYTQFYTKGFGRNCLLLRTIAKKLHKSNALYNLYLENQQSEQGDFKIHEILKAFFEIIQLEKNNT